MGLGDRPNELGLPTGAGGGAGHLDALPNRRGGSSTAAANPDLQFAPTSVQDPQSSTKTLSFTGGNILPIAQDILNIAGGIEDIKAGRELGREGKKARDRIAVRARLEFKQRGVLTRRLLARQRAQFAAAGVSPGGTQSAVQEFTSTQRALERRLILNDALGAANRIAREARRQEKRAKRAGIERIGQATGDFFGRLAASIAFDEE